MRKVGLIEAASCSLRKIVTTLLKDFYGTCRITTKVLNSTLSRGLLALLTEVEVSFLDGGGQSNLVPWLRHIHNFKEEIR